MAACSDGDAADQSTRGSASARAASSGRPCSHKVLATARPLPIVGAWSTVALARRSASAGSCRRRASLVARISSSVGDDPPPSMRRVATRRTLSSVSSPVDCRTSARSRRSCRAASRPSSCRTASACRGWAKRTSSRSPRSSAVISRAASSRTRASGSTKRSRTSTGSDPAMAKRLAARHSCSSSEDSRTPSSSVNDVGAGSAPSSVNRPSRSTNVPASRAATMSSSANNGFPPLRCQSSTSRLAAGATPTVTPSRSAISDRWSGPRSTRTARRSFHSAVIAAGGRTPVRRPTITNAVSSAANWCTSTADVSSR